MLRQSWSAPQVASVKTDTRCYYRLYDTDMAEMSVNEDVVCFHFPLAAGL
jgi:hypothetical protein